MMNIRRGTLTYNSNPFCLHGAKKHGIKKLRNVEIGIPAVCVVVTLWFVAVFFASVFSGSAADFIPRTTAPDRTNPYYYSDLNVFYKYGYGLPNCTAYAYGRVYEFLDEDPKLCPYDAQEWYAYNISEGCYDYGQTPRLGAIACWSYDGGGHVAVVEKIENDTLTFSNSEWGGRNFYLTTAQTSDPNFGGNNGWSFQGFIYALDGAR